MWGFSSPIPFFDGIVASVCGRNLNVDVWYFTVVWFLQSIHLWLVCEEAALAVYRNLIMWHVCNSDHVTSMEIWSCDKYRRLTMWCNRVPGNDIKCQKLLARYWERQILANLTVFYEHSIDRLPRNYEFQVPPKPGKISQEKPRISPCFGCRTILRKLVWSCDKSVSHHLKPSCYVQVHKMTS